MANEESKGRVEPPRGTLQGDLLFAAEHLNGGEFKKFVTHVVLPIVARHEAHLPQQAAGAMPSCHVCGAVMEGVCRKCGAATSPQQASAPTLDRCKKCTAQGTIFQGFCETCLRRIVGDYLYESAPKDAAQYIYGVDKGKTGRDYTAEVEGFADGNDVTITSVKVTRPKDAAQPEVEQKIRELREWPVFKGVGGNVDLALREMHEWTLAHAPSQPGAPQPELATENDAALRKLSRAMGNPAVASKVSIADGLVELAIKRMKSPQPSQGAEERNRVIEGSAREKLLKAWLAIKHCEGNGFYDLTMALYAMGETSESLDAIAQPRTEDKEEENECQS